MADLSTLRAELEALRTAYHAGATSVSYEGRSVVYTSGEDMRSRLAALEHEIAVAEGARPVRAVVIRSHKGW